MVSRGVEVTPMFSKDSSRRRGLGRMLQPNVIKGRIGAGRVVVSEGWGALTAGLLWEQGIMGHRIK